MKKAEHTSSLFSKFWESSELILRPEVLVRYHISGRIPLFGDDDWDISGIVSFPNRKPCQLICYFSRIDDDVFRLTAKELIARQLNYPLPGFSKRRRVMLPSGAPGVVWELGAIARFLKSEGIRGLRELTQEDLDRFIASLRETGASESTVAHYVTRFQSLYRCREFLSYDSLRVRPWGGRSATSVAGVVRESENKTPRLSEEMMRFLIQWSVVYVDHFSDDIIRAFEAYLSGMDRQHNDVLRTSRAVSEVRLRNWIEACRAAGLKLPGHNNRKGEVNIHRIAIAAKITNYAAYSMEDLIKAAADEIGTDSGFFDVPVKIIPEAGVTWREPFDEEAVLAEATHLMIACYVVCGFLSGMRDSELQSIAQGSINVVRDEFGEIVRHKVSSTEYKGNDKPVRRTWIIDAKAADAIRVLERLLAVRSRYAGSEKSQLLFQQARRFGTSLGQTVNAGINSFVRHASTILQPRLLALQIPILENLEENVTTRTLRRTISWFIANRPFGVLAGMLQFGHISEVIFEGYAGSTAAGFRAEVDRDRVAARRRDIVEMYEASQRGERVAGPMAEALDVEFERVATVLEDFPGKVVDEKRRMKMLEHLRVRLHPGLLADCFFEAEKARCLEAVWEIGGRGCHRRICVIQALDVDAAEPGADGPDCEEDEALSQ